MTFGEYIKACQKLADDNPECVNFPVIYSIDDEGNDFHHVNMEPSLQSADGLDEGYYIDLCCNSKSKPNCICIN